MRIIVAYKLVKAAILLVLAAILAVPAAGGADALHTIAVALQDHAVAAWSIAVAHLLVRATTRSHVGLITAGLALDGLFSLVEGWSLHRRYRWAPWLVIVATSLLLPFEVVELVRRATVGRAALLLLNSSIVAYLVRRRAVAEER